uniref:Recep_L_domain domain-containing protein n=1 Tax=Syphacia muris TaxID=451379 RepID=A0A0N5AB92_9BILA
MIARIKVLFYAQNELLTFKTGIRIREDLTEVTIFLTLLDGWVSLSMNDIVNLLEAESKLSVYIVNGINVLHIVGLADFSR